MRSFLRFLFSTSTNATLEIENIRFYSLEQPRLEIQRQGSAVVLTWPLTAAGYTLESTTSLTNPAWVAVTNAPTITADAYALTNSISDQSRYFRLRPR